MLRSIKTNLNPCAVMLVAGILLMVSSAFSIELVSAVYGFDVDGFDFVTEMMVGDLSTFELMTEFTLPLAFTIGAFLAAGGMSGYLFFNDQNSLKSASIS